MTSRTLSKRLARLETRLAPGAEPMYIQIQFVSPGGIIKDGPLIAVSSVPDHAKGVSVELPAAPTRRRS